MSSRARWRAAIAVLATLLLLLLIILIVNRWGAELEKINWPLVSLLCVFAFGAVMLYRWHMAGNDLRRYDLMDLVTTDGRADVWKHLLLLMSGLGAWSLVQVVLEKQWATVVPLLTLLIGAFVLKPVAKNFTDMLGLRAAAQAPGVTIDARGADSVSMVGGATTNTTAAPAAPKKP